MCFIIIALRITLKLTNRIRIQKIVTVTKPFNKSSPPITERQLGDAYF